MRNLERKAQLKDFREKGLMREQVMREQVIINLIHDGVHSGEPTSLIATRPLDLLVCVQDGERSGQLHDPDSTLFHEIYSHNYVVLCGRNPRTSGDCSHLLTVR